MLCLPIPFKLVTITGGITQLDLATSPLARAITRGARFLAVAALFYAFGLQARALIDRHFNTVMIGDTPLVILDLVAVTYL